MRTLVDGTVTRAQQESWKAGRLQRRWHSLHPELFDAEDLRLATGPQRAWGFHFVEWTAAIIVYHLTGYRSLVAKYQFANHPTKRKVIDKLRSESLVRALEFGIGGAGRAQGPDLLCFSPDHSDYFFCEVKGPGDRVTPNQLSRFRELGRQTGAEILLAKFRWARPMRRSAAG